MRITTAPIALILAALLAFGGTVPGAAPSAVAGESGVVSGEPVAAVSVAKKKKKKRKRRRVKVRKIRPKHQTGGVALDASIKIRFSRPVDPETVNERTIRFGRLVGDDIAWTAEFEKGNKQIVLRPAAYLDPGRDYEVRVRFGVLSERGEELKREVRSIFFTDPTVPPFQFLRPDQFQKLGSEMFVGRAAHSANRLTDGTVLIAGGQSDYVVVTDTAELFRPEEDRFVPLGSLMSVARAYHVGLEVEGGAMLLGGWDGSDASAATDIFDPTSRRFLPGPDMLERRDFLAATTLEDGRVLVVGGLSYSSTSSSYSLTAEIYDPSTGGWRETRGAPDQRRAGHTLTLLDNGKVLVAGGLPPGGSSGPLAELFDPVTEQFTLTGTNSLGYRQLHTATKLVDGRVLLADGNNGQMELYDPVSDRFLDAGGSSFARRSRATASLLPNGRVLLLGGFATVGQETLILDGMDLYLAALGGGSGRVVRVDVALDSPRAGHTATSLSDGRTLIVGGFGVTGEDSLATGLLLSTD